MREWARLLRPFAYLHVKRFEVRFAISWLAINVGRAAICVVGVSLLLAILVGGTSNCDLGSASLNGMRTIRHREQSASSRSGMASQQSDYRKGDHSVLVGGLNIRIRINEVGRDIPGFAVRRRPAGPAFDLFELGYGLVQVVTQGAIHGIWLNERLKCRAQE